MKNNKFLITGSEGFIAKNLIFHLKEKIQCDLVFFARKNNEEDLNLLVKDVSCIVHLAGENRPKNIDDFYIVNSELTRSLIEAVEKTGRNIPIIFSSSIHALGDSHYGISKLAAENLLQSYSLKTGNSVSVLRLPGVFGKWSKPNYNSVVSTFCHKISRGLPFAIDNPEKILSLVYIDHVVNDIIKLLSMQISGFNVIYSENTYSISVGDLAKKILQINEDRKKNCVTDVGLGFQRELYATYISNLPLDKFCYHLRSKNDDRGNFVEMLKTNSCGQISFFTMKVGAMRGNHYHHTKVEKFLVVVGEIKFKMINIVTSEEFIIYSSSVEPKIIESIPGWNHSIKNIGDIDAVVMLWSSESFSEINPDTYIL